MKKSLYSRQIAVICLALFGLIGCGFQFRDQNALPPGLRTLYLQTANPYGSLEAELRQTLRASGVVLVDNKKQAPVTLQLSNPVRTNSSATVGPSSQSRVYTLVYSVIFTLANSDGKLFMSPQTLTAVRTLTLAANQLLQSNNQLATLNKEMEREIIDHLYNHLRSQQVMQALQSKPL